MILKLNKRELEERDLEIHGNKRALQALKEALQRECHDPEIFVFDKDYIIEILTSLKGDVSSLEEKLSEKMFENSSSLKEDIAENFINLEK